MAPVIDGLPQLDRDLAAVLDAGDAAARLGPVDLRFGPLPLTVWSVEPSLTDHVLAHAASDVASPPWPALSVTLLDGSVLSEDRIPRPLLPRDEVGPVTVSEGVAHVGATDSTMVWVAGHDEHGSARALRWTRTAHDLPVWEMMRPLRFALRWAAVRNGAALVHTAAVAGERGSLLLVGAAGAGKSTTTFACVGSDLDVLGDDYCIVDPGADEVVVHATYVLGTLDDNSLALLPHLRDRVVREGLRGKSLLPLDSLAAGRASRPAVATCAVVRAPGERTRLVPTSRAAVLRALAPSTLFQIPGLQRPTWDVIAAVVRRLPAYELRVGSLADVPRVLGDLLTAGAVPRAGR